MVSKQCLTWRRITGKTSIFKSIALCKPIEHYLEPDCQVKSRPCKKRTWLKGGYIPPGTFLCLRWRCFRAMEGPAAPLLCVSEENLVGCDEADYCITRSVWARFVMV